MIWAGQRKKENINTIIIIILFILFVVYIIIIVLIFPFGSILVIFNESRPLEPESPEPESPEP